MTIKFRSVNRGQEVKGYLIFNFSVAFSQMFDINPYGIHFDFRIEYGYGNGTCPCPKIFSKKYLTADLSVPYHIEYPNISEKTLADIYLKTTGIQ